MRFAKAVTKYVKISPRKAAGLIRYKYVKEAIPQLIYSNLKGGRLLKKTLDSAVANAETQLNVNKDELIVHEVRIDEGPTLKRVKSKCRGGRVPIMKRTSHFTIILACE